MAIFGATNVWMLVPIPVIMSYVAKNSKHATNSVVPLGMHTKLDRTAAEENGYLEECFSRGTQRKRKKGRKQTRGKRQGKYAFMFR